MEEREFRSDPHTPPVDPSGVWRRVPGFRDLFDGLQTGAEAHLAHGLVPGAAVSLVSALFGQNQSAAVLIVPGNSEAVRMANDAAAWLGADAVEYLPPMDFLPEPDAVRSREIESTRLRVLGRLMAGEHILVVTSPVALERRLLPKAEMARLTMEVRRGYTLEPEELIARLESLGYSRDHVVVAPGTYARRGGIVDFFGVIEGSPVRVEFFGDRVDGIRYFDPETQRSHDNAASVTVPPAAETFPLGDASDLTAALDRMEVELRGAVEDLQRSGEERAAARLEGRVRRQMESLRAGLSVANFDPFFPYLCADMDTFFDYLPAGAPIFVWNPAEIERVRRGRSREIGERRERLLSDGTALPGQLRLQIDLGSEGQIPRDRPRVYASTILGRVEGEAPAGVVRIGSRTPEPFYGQWDMLRGELRRWREDGREVVITASDEDRAAAIREILGTEAPRVVASSLGEGFELPGAEFIIITEAEIRGRAASYRGFRVARGRRKRLEGYEDLRSGDYVVHRHHGIGQYLGLSHREVEGIERDYLTLRYAAGDRLYVPADSVDLIHKYSSADGEEPRIYRLGSGEWARVKARVKQSVRDMTRELLELYAARDRAEGHRFDPDTPWQKDFEDAFPFEETPDQVEVSDEIKDAMESPQPMDYLLCGDVGYGKTEVAFRAAFKAMAASKQVVFLVPTTVLAQQHYRTALERFAGWPFEIEVLSRFRSAGQQEETIRGLRRGSVDMVIGTHRLLGADVAFRDLGLIIVDEEHRFGVGHKEKLKQLRTSVDVLTLTATPIPRTLHMALSGIRDVGMIETPPEDRLPVVTYVMEYDSRLVADALHRELGRGGQAFYVHNRVRSIDMARRRVERMAPTAAIGVAHGQMGEHQLEAVMESFARGELDVLVCTTIIESGLDIPSVNTLIVEDADRLGLAQLYQLRGRVGRSDRLAYAYFTYRAGEVLTGTAVDRLHALREFTELGSGFRLAKRDLEIRGAGNVLGAEQHGFMLAVGFEMYTRFLREASEELMGEGTRPVLKPVVELSLDAYLPEEYVPDGRDRVALYRRLGDLEDLAGLRDLLDEILDRFGDPPAPVGNLVDLAELRLLAAERGIVRIPSEARGLILESIPRRNGPDWHALGRERDLSVAIREVSGGLRITLRPLRVGAAAPGIGGIRDLLRAIPPLDDAN